MFLFVFSIIATNSVLLYWIIISNDSYFRTSPKNWRSDRSTRTISISQFAVLSFMSIHEYVHWSTSPIKKTTTKIIPRSQTCDTDHLTDPL